MPPLLGIRTLSASATGQAEAGEAGAEQRQGCRLGHAVCRDADIGEDECIVEIVEVGTRERQVLERDIGARRAAGIDLPSSGRGGATGMPFCSREQNVSNGNVLALTSHMARR